MSIEVLMVVAGPESLEAVNARCLAPRSTVLNNLRGNRHYFVKALANLIKQSRTTGHRIPQQRIDFISINVTNNEDLQILNVHVEDPASRKTYSFEHAVCGRLVCT